VVRPASVKKIVVFTGPPAAAHCCAIVR